MKIKNFVVLQAPNIYGAEPYIVNHLDITDRLPTQSKISAQQQADMLAELTELAHLPAIPEPESNTDAALASHLMHWLTHTAIALQQLVGLQFECPYCDAAVQQRPEQFIVPFNVEEVGTRASTLALDWIDALTRSPDTLRPFDFQSQLAAFQKRAFQLTAPIQDRVLANAAKQRDIPVFQLAKRLFQLGHGRYQQRFSGSKTSLTNIVSNDISANKDYTKRILGSLGLPVSEYRRVYSATDAINAATEIGYPVVVKPNNGQMGRGISIEIYHSAEVRKAFKYARQYGQSVIVERFIPGQDFRMMVINYQLVAASQRVPAHVIGNGKDSVEQLVAEANSDPRRGKGANQPWTRITFNEQSSQLLKKRGYHRKSIPAPGETVFLRRNANTSDGGMSVDITDQVHPENRLLAERAARAIGLDIAGIDMMMDDIGKPLSEQPGCILEVNSRPGLRKHIWPGRGKPRDVTGAILSMLYPAHQPSRIPIFALTGNARHLALRARILALILQQDGFHVGLSTGQGVWSGGLSCSGDSLTATAAARMILSDPFVDCAVIVSTPEAILEHGLGYDACDISAVLCDAHISDSSLRSALQVICDCTRRMILQRGDYQPAQKTAVETRNIDTENFTDLPIASAKMIQQLALQETEIDHKTLCRCAAEAASIAIQYPIEQQHIAAVIGAEATAALARSSTADKHPSASTAG